MKTCSTCGETKPLDEFTIDRSKKDGLYPYCKLCRNARLRKSYAENRDERRANRREWYYENHKKRRQYQKQYHEDNRELLLERRRIKMAELRRDAIKAYGGGCSCCGEAQEEFLAIDHIEGGGAEMRRSIHGRGGTFYRWLKRNNYPDGFRVLCHNCNSSRGYYGYCPHELRLGWLYQVLMSQLPEKGVTL